MKEQTPCEKKGLREGQWVWFTGISYEDRSPQWVRLNRDDGTGLPNFYEDGEKYHLYLNEHIDWTQGIHDSKPNWTPREYGGEGPPVTIQRGDYILREDIPDEATFDAIVVECERQGVPLYKRCMGFNSPLNLDSFLLWDKDKEVRWAAKSVGSCKRRLTPADLGIAVPDEQPESGVKESLTTDDPRDPEFWKDAPEGATHWAEAERRRGGYGARFWKQVDEAWRWWDPANEQWWRSHRGGPSSELIPRPEPEQTAWSGPEDGLPPVGTVCEFQPTDGKWHEVEIVAHYGDSAVFAAGKDYPHGVYDGSPAPDAFRPLRSHRDRVIDEAIEVINRTLGTEITRKSSSAVPQALSGLYDADMLHLPESDD